MKSQISINKELSSLRNEIAGLRSDLGMLVEVLNKKGSAKEAPAKQLVTEKRDVQGNIDNRIFNILLNYQVPVNLKGFTYLKEAIKIYMNDRGSSQITKVVYPTIAKKFNDTSSRVERAIRHAIEKSWSKFSDANSFYFKCYSEVKPTNSEFVALVAGILLMEKQQESA